VVIFSAGLVTVRTLLSGVIGVLMCGGFAHAETTPRATISAQLSAFEQRSYEEAFRYASPRIQRVFKSPEAFRDMVIRDYPMIHDPRNVVYLETHDLGRSVYQEMLFVDVDGRAHSFFYEMVKIDGGWRIDGVYPHPTTGLDA
jgi:hypothetical protein